MNIDCTRNSNNLSPCVIASKYFSGNPGMDESLSEFQEKKKRNTGPKNCEPTGSKNKSKKGLKHIRGQKDIRTALKSKKNELISYANDFEKICIQSGIDVDPEQLQLAIAISKSLQQTESKSEHNSPRPGSLNAQERTGKIRTTLQEYGFKVPEVKITGKNKKVKSKKSYKLLLLTTAEKQQIISDKYSQVLFQNLDNTKIVDTVNQYGISKVHLYNLATGISYEYLKSDNIFYLEELVEKSPSTVGCLLRGWSEIPGRPASPIYEPSDFNFTDIECSQDELDSILSGSLKHAQEIIKNKHNLLVLEDSISKHTNILIEFQKESNINTNMDANTVEIVDDNMKTTDLEFVEDLTESHKFRSYSPDIFDDEVLSIMDNSKGDSDVISQDVSIKSTIKNNEFMDLTESVNVKIITLENTTINEKPICELSQESNTKRRSRKVISIMDNSKGDSDVISQDVSAKSTIKNNEFMDLTESVNVKIITLENTTINEKPICELSQESNTKRRSNDFMELTECISVNSEPVILNVDENIDLTQNCGYENSAGPIMEEMSCIQSKDVETVDLTQSSNSEDSLPFIQICVKSKSLDDTLLHDDASDRSKPLQDTIIFNNDVFDERDTLFTKENKESVRNDLIPESKYSKDKMFDDVLTEKCITFVKQDANNEPSSSIEVESVSSQDSEVFEIPVKLDNSLNKPKHEIVQSNFDLGGISFMDIYFNTRISKSSNFECHKTITDSTNDSFLPMVDLKGSKSETVKIPAMLSSAEASNLFKKPSNEFKSPATPKNSKYIIKTEQVTPMPNYESMTMTEINRELDKYGLKRFKRDRAIQLLTYVYNQTHPVVESCSSEDLPSSPKRFKSAIEELCISPEEMSGSSKKILGEKENSTGCNVDVADIENDLYEVTTEVPNLKEIECSRGYWVFPKREKAKVHSCRVPLHIAFHNYVSARKGVWEAILLSEPINVNDVHRGLLASGYRYDPKYLQKFMEMKGITVSTVETGSKENRRR